MGRHLLEPQKAHLKCELDSGTKWWLMMCHLTSSLSNLVRQESMQASRPECIFWCYFKTCLCVDFQNQVTFKSTQVLQLYYLLQIVVAIYGTACNLPVV